jgi:hypothetical protein
LKKLISLEDEVPLQGSEQSLADALKSAAKSTDGDADRAWEKVADTIIRHIAENAVITGTTPNGGPIMEGKIT